VSLRNDQGCVFPGKTILSVTQWEGYSDFRYFITPTDCPWYPPREDQLTPEGK